ncbi:SPOR domain-containing protein [Pseudoalteromonas sp. FUC4]|uniref:SPOR domain-containing protein n=1 Tax=Pseudoalteromonas sp. FUC4 TaxID=2511201 RepID=UPI0011F39F92|nr:SPOR domain-containing protein [Pseudoalteromonas sp. FUC4]KAA1152786.1 SPOR domain-containing protein [Pseudoalteromonas sp. FUC4]
MLLKPIFKSTVLLMVLALAACNSPQQVKATQTNPQPILIEKSDLELLKVSVAQWESSQPKVEQLLKLENKLTQLATNLKQLNGFDVLNTPVNDVVNNESVLKPHSVSFALQIAAFKNKNALQKKLREFQEKIPHNIISPTEVNVETVRVNNTTFYRLKLGVYSNSADAKSDCLALIKQKVACFVSYYIKQPYKQ